MKMFRKTYGFAVFLVILALVSSLSGCGNEPSDLGLEYILSDTLGTKILDSQKDSIQITSNNLKKYINTFISPNILVGRYQGYESRPLLRFTGLSPDYDSADVISAKIEFTYSKYFFPDSAGVTSFDVFSINKYHDFAQVTLDSFSNSEIGTTVLGSFSGVLSDTSVKSFTFDSQTAEAWLEYAADTNYPVRNYGIILQPNASSTAIKGLFSGNSASSERSPKLIIVVSKNSKTDTLSYGGESVSLNDAPPSILYSDRFVIQNGVSYLENLRFDLSKLPGRVIINEAFLQLKMDYANSVVSQSTDRRLQMAMITDSTAKLTDDNYFFSTLSDSVTHVIRLNAIFQKWNNGTSPNYGLLIGNVYNAFNVDRYVFFSPAHSDTALRPKLIIRYTERN